VSLICQMRCSSSVTWDIRSSARHVIKNDSPDWSLPCEAFDNIPPGLPGRVFALAGRVSGGFWLAAHPLRLPGVARLPMTFGRMTRRPIPRRLLQRWTEPVVSSQEVRRDLMKYTLADDYALLADGMAELRRFRAATLIVWPRRDRLMPPSMPSGCQT
jgi:hypothetical protein